jgi:hypothetical protein
MSCSATATASRGFANAALEVDEADDVRFFVLVALHPALDTVIVELNDYATALACYRSNEYAGAMAIRKGASIGDLKIVEGYDGPQPADS